MASDFISSSHRLKWYPLFGKRIVSRVEGGFRTNPSNWNCMAKTIGQSRGLRPRLTETSQIAALTQLEPPIPIDQIESHNRIPPLKMRPSVHQTARRMTLHWPLSARLIQFRALLTRVRDSAVVWSGLFNALRLASGLILLPLVLRKFTTPDFGMYYVLLSLSALVPLVDFGFGPTIGRFVSYALGGAETVQTHGLAKPGSSAGPNYALLWQLLYTARRLYRVLVLALLVILGTWGTYLVEIRIQETSSVLITRLAWLSTLLTALFDIYSNWWVVYLRNLNRVVTAARIDMIAMTVRLVLGAALLLAGAGLL